ncbi:MAG TPA: hypothetical protein DCR55_12915 [Lentisphaeria bacterium]|nr:hypothetical protein [Lentisphaeria bacterium]
MKDKLNQVAEFFRLYYDKILLGFTLLLLIGTLFVAMTTQKGHKAAIEAKSKDMKLTKTAVEILTESDFDIKVKFAPARMWMEDFTNHKNDLDGGFAQPAYYVFPVNADSDESHVLHRDTKINPWTAFDQTIEGDIGTEPPEEDDTDAGGLADDLEKLLGLNIHDPADDIGDFDGDMFSNREEQSFCYRNDKASLEERVQYIQDPGMHPPLATAEHERLRFRGAKRDRLPFTLKRVATNGFGEDDRDKWEIHFSVGKRSPVVKLGDMIPGTKYKLVGAEFREAPDAKNPGIQRETSIATVQKSGSSEIITCNLKKSAYGLAKVVKLSFYYGEGPKSIIVREEETFKLKDLAGNEESYRLTARQDGDKVDYFALHEFGTFAIKPLSSKEEHLKLMEILQNVGAPSPQLEYRGDGPPLPY